MARKYKLPWRLRFLLWVVRVVRPPAHKLSLKQIQKLRKPFPIKWLQNWVLGRPVPFHRVEERKIPVRDAELPARFYFPSDEKGLPVILNYHGGGWMLGNLDQSDDYCRKIARDVGAIVISVDYRMAPEHRFPVAANDAYDAFLWAQSHASEFGGDGSRIAVTGDSAGGNLSAVVAMMARDLGKPMPCFQGLVYPATNARLDFPSFVAHPNAPILSQRDIRFFMTTYEAKPNDRLHPYFSPYLAEDRRNLPPALILVAEYDPLMDDGKWYGEKLRAAGVEVEVVEYEREIHGFMTFPNHSRLQPEALAKMVASLRKYFATG